jgi:site-specific recombinase XerD
VQRIGGEAVRSRVKKIGKSVGIEGVHPHLFRKTMATTALKRGMSISDVQKLLGHESINTTTIYTQVNDDDVHRMHEKFII